MMRSSITTNRTTGEDQLEPSLLLVSRTQEPRSTGIAPASATANHRASSNCLIAANPSGAAIVNTSEMARVCPVATFS